MTNELRNICIIAHVDHGKTTLVDHLLKQAGTFQRENLDECIMDTGDLEKERGITILAKNASIKLDGVKVNIVDTPGHADFGGEVERIMNMVDGAILLVDAAEGPLPQTRFVIEKAIEQGLKLVLVINKVDRSEIQGSSRINEVINKTFDLIVDLGGDLEQADCPILYACGRRGWCTSKQEDIEPLLSGEKKGDLKELFDLLVNYIPAPKIAESSDFQLLVANLVYSEFVGQMAVGRVLSGQVARNDILSRLGVNDRGEPITQEYSATRLYCYEGLNQKEVTELVAGDIGLIAGTDNYEIGDTISSNPDTPPHERLEVEKPTLAMIFAVNTSPLSGTEGEAIQSRKLRERLINETRTNVALKFEETEFPDQFRLLGRGELQFGIIIEQMRREGLEFMVGRPQVLMKKDDDGNTLEPYESVVIDVPEKYSGDVAELFQNRKGIMSSYENLDGVQSAEARIRLVFEIPTRGLLGVNSNFITITHGEGLMSAELLGYQPLKGEITNRLSGTLICDRIGKSVEYALLALEQRGILLIQPGVRVYEGMVVGECAKPHDLDVNPTKEKKLTNVRTVLKDTFVKLKGIKKMSLEQCIEWIEDDEWIEITPESIRIRKKILSKNHRHVTRNKY